MGRIIEGVWDCKYCGTDKIRGSVYKCPNCGRQRDNNVTFYIDNPKNYVSKEKEEKLNKNPDWLCSFCDGLNSDDNDVCYNCGASKAESEMNYFQNKAKQAETERRRKANSSYDKKENYNTEETTEDKVEKLNEANMLVTHNDVEEELIVNSINEDYKDEYQASQKKNKQQFFKKIVGITAGIFAVIMTIVGILWLCSPKIQDVTVQSFEWERVLEVEEYKTVQESDWSVPDGGRIYDEKTEIRSYVQVLDHYETKTRTYTEQVIDHYEDYVSGHRDLGNGHFEEIISQRPVYRTETKTETYQEPVYRQDPVYDTKYYYEIERWVHKENLKTSGTDQKPVWQEYEYKEKEREGSKSEKYTVIVKTKKEKIKEYDLKYNEWIALKQGQKIKLKTYITGNAELILK